MHWFWLWLFIGSASGVGIGGAIGYQLTRRHWRMRLSMPSRDGWGI